MSSPRLDLSVVRGSDLCMLEMKANPRSSHPIRELTQLTRYIFCYYFRNPIVFHALIPLITGNPASSFLKEQNKPR